MEKSWFHRIDSPFQLYEIQKLSSWTEILRFQCTNDDKLSLTAHKENHSIHISYFIHEHSCSMDTLNEGRILMYQVAEIIEEQNKVKELLGYPKVKANVDTEAIDLIIKATEKIMDIISK